MNNAKYLVLAVSLAAVAVIYRYPPAVIHFRPYSPADFTQQLTPLVLIALFIERSLEVFITVWRGGGLGDLQHSVDQANALPDSDPQKAAKIQAANQALDEYKFKTQKIAMPSALVMGILISALGVRGLGNFADLDKLVDHPTQRYLFNVADVLLSGALVGGGSDFMHKVITTFTDVLDATSQKAKSS